MPYRLLHAESFDYYGTTQLTDRYDTVSGGSVTAGKGRRGSAGFWGFGPQGGNLYKSFREDFNDEAQGANYILHAGAAYNFPHSTAFDVSAGLGLIFLHATNHFGELTTLFSSITPDGRFALTLYGGFDAVSLWVSPPGVLRLGQGWRYVEMAAGLDWNGLRKRYDIIYLALRCDEALLFETHGPIATDFVRGFSGFTYRVLGDVRMDDCVIVATGDSVADVPAGGDHFVGDAFVLPIFPDGVGDVTGWTPDPVSAAAGVANWDTVEEHPPSDADYLTTGVAGTRDRYELEDLDPTVFPADTEIIGIAANLRAQKLDIGPRQLGATLESGGVAVDHDGEYLGDLPYYYQFPRAYDPDGEVPWTVASVNALRAGPHLI